MKEVFLKIHQMVARIPKSKVATYGQINKITGLPPLRLGLFQRTKEFFR